MSDISVTSNHSAPVVPPVYTGRSASQMEQMLKMDDAMPANCFTFKGTALSEGIELVQRHPAAPANCFMTSTGKWMKRAYGDESAVFRKINRETSIMRRSAIVEVTRDDNKPSYMAFGNPGNNQPAYGVVSVDGNVVLPAGVKPKAGVQQFAFGIVGDIVLFGTSMEGIYRLTNASPIRIFRPDGTVIEIIYNDGSPKVLLCDAGESFLNRMDFVQTWLLNATQLDDSAKVAKSEDRACYELIAMMKFVKRFAHDTMVQYQEQIVDVFDNLRDEGSLRRPVHEALRIALDGCVDTVRWRFTALPNIAVSDSVRTPEQLKLRQQRLDRQRNNRQKRADENRARMRANGSGGGKNKK